MPYFLGNQTNPLTLSSRPQDKREEHRDNEIPGRYKGRKKKKIRFLEGGKAGVGGGGRQRARCCYQVFVERNSVR